MEEGGGRVHVRGAEEKSAAPRLRRASGTPVDFPQPVSPLRHTTRRDRTAAMISAEQQRTGYQVNTRAEAEQSD